MGVNLQRKFNFLVVKPQAALCNGGLQANKAAKSERQRRLNYSHWLTHHPAGNRTTNQFNYMQIQLVELNLLKKNNKESPQFAVQCEKNTQPKEMPQNNEHNIS